MLIRVGKGLRADDSAHGIVEVPDLTAGDLQIRNAVLTVDAVALTSPGAGSQDYKIADRHLVVLVTMVALELLRCVWIDCAQIKRLAIARVDSKIAHDYIRGLCRNDCRRVTVGIGRIQKSYRRRDRSDVVRIDVLQNEVITGKTRARPAPGQFKTAQRNIVLLGVRGVRGTGTPRAPAAAMAIPIPLPISSDAGLTIGTGHVGSDARIGDPSTGHKVIACGATPS